MAGWQVTEPGRCIRRLRLCHPPALRLCAVAVAVAVGRWAAAPPSAIAQRVWMDLNADGDFDDVVDGQLERVTESPNVGGGTTLKSMFQNYFVVPAGFDGLETRMRIAMAEKIGDATVAPGPTGTFASGEVEDYTVRFLPMPEAQTTPPSNPRVFELELYHMRSWFYATEYGDRGMRFGLATGTLGGADRIETPEPEPPADAHIFLPIARQDAE